ncbi:hypothetical protein HK101_004694 [Irineochytrium annulatum]|nr:hypothetical protein HK101_004694 [Irineochytrium annulatum]
MDEICSGYIVNKLLEDVLALFEGLDTAFKMMQKLEEHFRSYSTATALRRLDQLLDMRYTPGEDMNLHICRVNRAMREIEHGGTLSYKTLHILIYLRSMPKNSDWSPLVTALMAQDEKTLTPENVGRSLVKKALQLSNTNCKDATARKEPKDAFNATSKPQRRNLTCLNCKKKGRLKAGCWAPGGGAEGQGPHQRNRADGGLRQLESKLHQVHYIYLSQ